MPTGAVLLDGRVVWAQQGGEVVRAVPVAGGEPATLAWLGGEVGLGVEGPDLYRLEYRHGALADDTSTTVVRSGLDGSAPEPLAVVSTGVHDTWAILRAGRVVARLCDVGPNTCTLRVVPLDGGAPADLLTIGGSFDRLEADAKHAYWLESNPAQTLRRIPLAGGPPEVVAEPAGGAYLAAFALDAQGLVVSEVDLNPIVVAAKETSRRLLRVPAAGGARVVLGERAGVGDVRQVLLVGQEIIWRDADGVFSTPQDGGVTTPLPAAPLPADHEYWSLLPASGTIYCAAVSSGYVSRGFVAPLAGGEGWGDLSLPSLFAADEAFLYWHASTGQLSRAPLGGGPVEALAGGFTGYPRLARGGGRLYGFAGAVVKEIDLASGIPRERLLADDTINHLAADEEAAYATTGAGSLWRIPAAGGQPQRVAGGFYGAITRLRAAGGFVYWNQSLPPPGFREALYRMPGVGGDRITVAEVDAGFEDLLPAGDFVYFKTTGGGIGRVPAGGGAIQPLTGAIGGPLVLAADATHLYAAGGTDVFKLPLAGGAIVPLHMGDFIGPNSLAVDGTSVYWTDTYHDAIFRLSPK